MTEEQDVILVDLSAMSGIRGVARPSATDLAEKSAELIEKSMSTIRGMAKKVVETAESIKVSERPAKVEVEFGIKLDAEAGALLAKASAETTMNVTLTWERKDAAK
jgi:hypothetical protein